MKKKNKKRAAAQKISVSSWRRFLRWGQQRAEIPS